jgi:hypothetical protein
MWKLSLKAIWSEPSEWQSLPDESEGEVLDDKVLQSWNPEEPSD